MSLRAQLFLALAIGGPGIVLAGAVDDRFIALCLPAGLLLAAGGVRILRDRAEWERFRAGQLHFPGGGPARVVFALAIGIIGLGWACGGVLGVLALLGIHDFGGT